MTNQQNIIQLIKQWQELEPSKIEMIGDKYPIHYVWLDEKRHPVTAYHNDRYELWKPTSDTLNVVQSAIQAQIVKREYALEVNYYPADFYYDNATWQCRITYDVGKSTRQFEADNLAEAMLKAYVEVLKIKQGVK